MNIIDLTVNDQKKIRRIALRAQGVYGNPPFGRGLNAAQRCLEHLGYVQIDTISVVERAHHHVLRTRVDNYQVDWLNRLLQRRAAFEHWAHAAAVLPMSDYRYSLYFKAAIKAGRHHFARSRDKKLMAQILRRVQAEGPLRSRDFETNVKQKSGWWDWKPAKRALEHLYLQGDLMVVQRDGFEKTYDLTERVVPQGVNTIEPDPDDMASHMIEQNLRSHGLATLKGFAYLRRDDRLRRAVKSQVEAACAERTLLACRTPDGQIFYVPPGHLEARAPTSAKRAFVLSPFDNAVIQRQRLNSLFNFDYQIECYVPAAKRRYGYFALPLLYGDMFIGLLDAKAHRSEGILEIKALHLFVPIEADMGSALSRAVAEFAHFNTCGTVRFRPTATTKTVFDASAFAAHQVALIKE